MGAAASVNVPALSTEQVGADKPRSRRSARSHTSLCRSLSLSLPTSQLAKIAEQSFSELGSRAIAREVATIIRKCDIDGDNAMLLKDMDEVSE